MKIGKKFFVFYFNLFVLYSIPLNALARSEKYNSNFFRSLFERELREQASQRKVNLKNPAQKQKLLMDLTVSNHQKLQTQIQFKNLPQHLPRESVFLTPFSVSSSPWKSNIELQEMIEDLTTRIFSTPTGKVLCSFYSMGDPYVLVRNLSVRLPVAENLINTHCGLYKNGSFPSQGISAAEKKRWSGLSNYTFILSESESPKLNGWTAGGSTFFAFSLNEVSEVFLIRLLIHEMYMIIDNKNDFSLNLIQSHQGVNSPLSCREKLALMDQEILLASASIRAFKVENQILSDLGYPVEEWPKGISCTRTVEAFIPLIKDFTSMWDLKQSVALSEIFKSCPAMTESSSRSSTIRARLLLLENFATSFSNSTCQYLTTPGFSAVTSNQLLRVSGPRPRINDGAGRTQMEISSPELFLRKQLLK